MSVVSGLILVCDLGSIMLQEAERPPGPIVLINRWLTMRSFSQLIDNADNSGGNKHPQAMIFTAGYNHFPEDDFALFFKSLDWEDPERVVLIIQPEHGSTRVFRPAHITDTFYATD